MPSLQLTDIPRVISTIPSASVEEQGVQLLRHELFTNDVLYVEAALDMQTVPANLLHLVPLFCRCAMRFNVPASIDEGSGFWPSVRRGGRVPCCG